MLRVKIIAEKIIAFRWATIVFVIVTTLFFGTQLSNLKLDADILRSLPDNDKHAKLLKGIAEDFGGNNMGVIILESNTIYQTKILKQIRSITDSLIEIQGISSVSSLTNIIQISGSEYGIEVGTLVDEYELPDSPEAFETLKKNIHSNEMYKGSIVSEDGTSTLIIFTLEDSANVTEVATKVITVTESIQQTEKLYYTGSPMLVSAISNLMRKDLTTLLPLAFFLIAILLYLSFRSAIGVLLPLLTAVIAIIWSLGTMALLGVEMSMISNNIPIILLAIGTAYTIHVINRVNETARHTSENTISAALGQVMIPVVLAAITTAIGFLSFIFGAYLEMIVDFGIFTALGTLFACLLSIFFVPAIMQVFVSKNKSVEPTDILKLPLIEKFLGSLNTMLFKHPKNIFKAWMFLLVISVFGIFSIKRSVDIQEFFKKGNPTRQAENIMVEKFGGTKPVFVLFKGNIQSPEVLNMMLQTADYMEESPDIYTSLSVATLISEINFAITGKKEIPKDEAQINQLWFLIDGNEAINRLVSEDLSQGIIISKFKSPDNKAKQHFANYMDRFIKTNSTENCRIEITGMPFVDITMDRSLINSQLGSIIIAIIFVIIIIRFILGSWRNGVLTSIPIIAAILILFGIMGISGISLNIATVLVASVSLGIGIDYSIHIITHYRDSLKETGNFKTALENSILISGRAIIINVVSVAVGFLVLVFSEMVPLQYFGLLIALSMVGSGLGALTLLPVILILLNNKRDVK